MNEELTHYQVKGAKHGIRRWQNEDGSLTAAGRIHYGVGKPREKARYKSPNERSEVKWLQKHGKKIADTATRDVQGYMNAYAKQVLNTSMRKLRSNGKVSKNYMFAYNKKLAEVLNTSVANIQSPGKNVVRFVANRGSIGVTAGLATPGYDMRQVKTGVYANGRLAYSKKNLAAKR